MICDHEMFTYDLDFDFKMICKLNVPFNLLITFNCKVMSPSGTEGRTDRHN